MRTRRGDDSFDVSWLAVAIRALLHDRTSATPVAVGLDTAGRMLIVELDETGLRVGLDPDPVPGTVLRVHPEVVLALAAGAISPKRAVTTGTLRG